MRKVILSMQMSLDGYVEGPAGSEMNWIQDEEEQWTDIFETLQSVDACITGRVMSEGYYDYWNAVLADPNAKKDELAYARWADKTPHYIFSQKWDTAKWKNASILKGSIEEETAKLKQQPGKDIIIWGGASLASAFINSQLVDEYRLVIDPIILGGGKRLFENVSSLQRLQLVSEKRTKSGGIIVKYATVPAE